MLNSHPEMKVYTELFLPDAEGQPFWPPSGVYFYRTFLEEKRGSSLPVARAYWTAQYLKYVYSGADASVIGFKYMYNQIRHSLSVLPFAARGRVKIVHLVRRNLLDIIISAKLAETTGLYHLAGDRREAVPWWPTERTEPKIRLDASEVLSGVGRLAQERQWMRLWLRRSRTPHYELEYERAAEDERAFSEVLDFLGLPMPSEGLHSGLEKVRTKSQAEVVENLAEIRAALAATPYASLVHE